jgi:hypothetical protein
MPKMLIRLLLAIFRYGRLRTPTVFPASDPATAEQAGCETDDPIPAMTESQPPVSSSLPKLGDIPLKGSPNRTDEINAAIGRSGVNARRDWQTGFQSHV